MGGHGKGSNFERLVSRMFSKWWTHGERDDIFWRTACSGGWNHARRNNGKTTSTQYGDIQALDPIGQPLIDALCIEIKIGYGKWSVLDCIDRPGRGAEQIFDGFMKQVTEECDGSRAKYPILIAKRDMRECVIFIPNHLFSLMREKYTTKKLNEMDCYAMWIRVPSYKKSHILVLRFDEFLEWCPPEFFMDRKNWDVEESSQLLKHAVKAAAQGFPDSPKERYPNVIQETDARGTVAIVGGNPPIGVMKPLIGGHPPIGVAGQNLRAGQLCSIGKDGKIHATIMGEEKETGLDNKKIRESIRTAPQDELPGITVRSRRTR